MASVEDAPALHSVIQDAFRREAERTGKWDIAPLAETLEGLSLAMQKLCVLVACEDGTVVGTGRVRIDAGVGYLGRLAVLPSHQGRGIGKALICALEAACPEAGRFVVFTSEYSLDNIALYGRMGYVCTEKRRAPDGVMLQYMEKRLS